MHVAQCKQNFLKTFGFWSHNETLKWGLRTENSLPIKEGRGQAHLLIIVFKIVGKVQQGRLFNHRWIFPDYYGTFPLVKPSMQTAKDGRANKQRELRAALWAKPSSERPPHLSVWLAQEGNAGANSSRLNADDTGTTFGVPVLWPVKPKPFLCILDSP